MPLVPELTKGLSLRDVSIWALASLNSELPMYLFPKTWHSLYT